MTRWQRSLLGWGAYTLTACGPVWRVKPRLLDDRAHNTFRRDE